MSQSSQPTYQYNQRQEQQYRHDQNQARHPTTNLPGAPYSHLFYTPDGQSYYPPTPNLLPGNTSSNAPPFPPYGSQPQTPYPPLTPSTSASSSFSYNVNPPQTLYPPPSPSISATSSFSYNVNPPQTPYPPPLPSTSPTSSFSYYVNPPQTPYPPPVPFTSASSSFSYNVNPPPPSYAPRTPNHQPTSSINSNAPTPYHASQTLYVRPQWDRYHRSAPNLVMPVPPPPGSPYTSRSSGSSDALSSGVPDTPPQPYSAHSVESSAGTSAEYHGHENADESSDDGSYDDRGRGMESGDLTKGFGEDLQKDLKKLKKWAKGVFSSKNKPRESDQPHQSERSLAPPNHPPRTHQSGRPGPPSFPSPLMTTCRTQQPYSISYGIGSAVSPTSLGPATPGLGYRNSFHQDQDHPSR
ncbi:hypothetical protein FRB94_005659 [Tulasnella sp. JGI-2019a]|nr:hypothetical protein FRB94_005659 [Tulasnella sp. JGI-2019a]